MDKSFCYKRLEDAQNSIRLLQILRPTYGSDTIRCSLVTARLDEKPSYEALSYAWGSRDSPITIQCDGRDISITRNLYQALRSLQRLQDSTDRLFWIDALCINQNDTVEKSSQVGLMHQIYAAARNVIVWPGESTFDGHLYGESVNRSMVDVGLDDNPQHEKRLRGSILKYLKAPIFNRVWVLQEILSSRKASLLLEDGETEWDTFWSRAAIETVTSIADSGDRSLLSASMKAFQFYTATSSIKLITASSERLARVPSHDSGYEETGVSALAYSAHALATLWAKTLNFTATLNTTDPRDRVFALVGLAATFGITVPRPDYSKSTPIVFQEALSMLETRHKNNPPLFPPYKTALQLSGRELALLLRPGSGGLDKYPAGNWQYPLENSHSPKTCPAEAGESPELSYDAFFDHILQHHKKLLCTDILHHLAWNLPQASLMCLDGADSTRNTESQQASDSLAPESGRAAAANARSVAKRKRRGGNRKRGEDDDEDEEEGDDERQYKKQILDPWKRLACPYFQRDRGYPRRRAVCRGPGFETTARLKEHLYRVHHIHPCLRCGKIFKSREAVSQHSQLIQPCNPVQWRHTFNPSQGFEDFQKEKLGKKTVRTWQQIFGILFPRDDPASYPPQHYTNTSFVQLLDQFHQHYLVESRRILSQRLANDSSTINQLQQGQPGQLGAYALQLLNDVFAQIIGTFRAELVRRPSTPDVNERASHTIGDADHHLMQPAVSEGVLAEPMLQPTSQSEPQFGHVGGAVQDPAVAFEQYLTSVAPAGTFEYLSDLFGDEQDAIDGRDEHEWSWEDLGTGSS